MRNIFTLAIALLVGGCAEGITVYHNRAVDPAKPRVITVDAKQRSLIMTPEAAKDKPQWRVCAEAAPDVFSALSASASLEADIASKSGKAAAAIAESAATIERTQTINLLRESMYRTCERYLSGALSKEIFIVQAARDQRAMVAVLAIEQLTGAFRRPSTILVAPSTSATTANGAKAAELIEQFSKQKQDAIAAKKTENGKYNDALVKGKCDKITTAPADETSSPKLSEWTSCVAAKARSDAADAEAKAATERLDKVIDATMVLASTTTASTGTEQSQNGAATTSPSDGASLQKVAEIVGQIAQAPGLDEALMFCIAYLQSDTANKETVVTAKCLEILSDRARIDEFIRADNFKFKIDGQTFIKSSATTQRDGGVGDRIVDYLDAKDKPDDKARRQNLALQAARQLNLAQSFGEVALLAIDGEPSKKMLLLGAMIVLETEESGKQILTK